MNKTNIILHSSFVYIKSVVKDIIIQRRNEMNYENSLEKYLGL